MRPVHILLSDLTFCHLDHFQLTQLSRSQDAVTRTSAVPVTLRTRSSRMTKGSAGRGSTAVTDSAESSSPLSPSLEAELADWRRKVLSQRESIAQSERERGDLRSEVERLQQKVSSLTSGCLRGIAQRILPGIVVEVAAMVWPKQPEDMFTQVSKELKRKLRKGERDWTSLVEEVTKDFLHWRGIHVEEALIAEVVETSQRRGCQRYQFLERGSQRRFHPSHRYVRLSEPIRQRQPRETGRPRQLEVDEVDFYKFSVDMAKFLRQGTRPYKDLAAVFEEFKNRGRERSHVEQLLHTLRHKDGRCRFERRQLDGREVLWATPNSGPFRKAQELRSEIIADMREFDEKINRRGHKLVLFEDSEDLNDMCTKVRLLLAIEISDSSWLESEACHICRLYNFDEIELDCVPGVMTRYRIFDGDAIEIRDPSLESTMQKQEGGLKTMNAHSFHEGDWYFLDHEAPHTVRPGGGKALTIFVRGKSRFDTWIRSTEAKVPDESRAPDTCIEGAADKMDFLEEIWQLLQPPRGARWKRQGTRTA
eukprot:s734_g9.t1